MGSAREERDLSQRGQSMIEYALLIVLVVLMALGLLRQRQTTSSRSAAVSTPSSTSTRTTSLRPSTLFLLDQKRPTN